MRLVTLATCNLAQWALDFAGNLERIKASIVLAKAQGARYRVGPELEVSGYGCEDHFLEGDTYLHCWQAIAALLAGDWSDDCLVDVGMPVIHRNVRYNCRVFLLNRRILFIRPKLALADDGNYRESRWFTAWQHRGDMQDYYLPRTITVLTGQTVVPLGDGCLALEDTCIGVETCEELFTPLSPHIPLTLDGVEILSNGSSSHHELRKLQRRVDLIISATKKCGGIYLYANQQCCDGGRLYYDGGALIASNGRIHAQGSQFSMRDVEVVTATLDLSDVRVYRGMIASRAAQAAHTPSIPRVAVPFQLTRPSLLLAPTAPLLAPRYLQPEEEIAYGPACWLWDYLRRSGLRGFFLPLSGGADSAATAAIVGAMCTLLSRDVKSHAPDLRRVSRLPADVILPTTPRGLASLLFHTAYLASAHSSETTRVRAREIAEAIGSQHHELVIDDVTRALVVSATPALPREPQFRAHGGSPAENLALQNVQARTRMVLSYLLAQLVETTGALLVLGSGNVDEALRGYLTKYDCSSADLNPIGAISKHDLRAFLIWAAKPDTLGYTPLKAVAEATPTAELEPRSEAYEQSDERDMGMTYAELREYGRLRKLEACGPVAMFRKLVHAWPALPARTVAAKVQHFFRMYAINRHKVTTLTPAYHAEAYSPDDNRHDLRPFLYPKWTWQFAEIDRLVDAMEAEVRDAEGDRHARGVKRAREEDPPVEATPALSKNALHAELAEAEQRVADLRAQLNASS